MKLTKHERRTPLLAPLTADFAREAQALRNDFRRLLSEAFGTALPQPIGWAPSVEISETDDELIINAELPGMKRDDVKVEYDEGVLTLSGEKKEEKEEKEKNYYLFERSFGAFERSFTLPREVDPEKIRAEMRDGVLSVRLAKTPTAKAHGRTIAIEEAKT